MLQWQWAIANVALGCTFVMCDVCILKHELDCRAVAISGGTSSRVRTILFRTKSLQKCLEFPLKGPSPSKFQTSTPKLRDRNWHSMPPLASSNCISSVVVSVIADLCFVVSVVAVIVWLLFL